jgi:predicted RNase H-like HicB family nuclease
MKEVYPIIITETDDSSMRYVVYVPDFDINTEGKDIEEALFMAKDAIGLAGICMEDDGKAIPKAKTLKIECKENQFSALIDVDFTAYREKEENRTVRKNCTIPLWLNREAEAKHINFSAVLTNALKQLIS